MKRLLLLLALFCTAHAPLLPAQTGLIDQPSEVILVSEDKFFRFYGISGRTYFFQIADPSMPLQRWEFAPIIEAGNDEWISYELDGTPPFGFFRLQYTDEPVPPGVSLEDWDPDGDLLPTWWELENNLSPLDATGDHGAAGDPDGDGVSNIDEYQNSTDPNDSGSRPPLSPSPPILLQGEFRGLWGYEVDPTGDNPYHYRTWSYGSVHSPAPDAGTPVAAAVNGGIGASPWLPYSPEPGNLAGGAWKQSFLVIASDSGQYQWSLTSGDPPITSVTWSAWRFDRRMRIFREVPGPLSYKERYLKVRREGPINMGLVPPLEETEITDVEIVELTIPAGQQYSGWLTIGVEAKNGIHRTVHLQPADITVAFGNGPDTPVDGQPTSRELLETYLEGVKIARDGDVWVVQGKDSNDNDRIYCVEIVDHEKGLVEALQAEGRTVVFDGHSNFGFGPSFGHTIRNIDDFTNFGAQYTDIPLDYWYRGSHPIPQHDSANSHLWGKYECPFIVITGNDIAANPVNYKPLPIDILRFPNDDNVGEGQAFTLQGEGMEAWHYKTGGSKRLMVRAPKSDLPAQLRYKTFFYNACSTGIDYIENFKHGEFVYTTLTCSVHQATRIFVKGVVEGKTTAQIMPLLNAPNVGAPGNPPDDPIYEYETF